jgi:thiol-disulfide isomerase/thioredoxin
MLANGNVMTQPSYQAPVVAHAGTVNELVSIEAQGKTTVLYFFAPWCQICHLSIGNLQAQYEKNNNIAVIAIALDYSDKAEVLAFVDQHKLTFPVVLGTQQIKSAFNIKAYPSYYILDKNNIIMARSLGYSTELGLYLRTL